MKTEKIEIEIPEWAKNNHIYVTTDNELIAYSEVVTVHENGKHVNKRMPIKTKVARCNGCGECCEGCIFLRKDGCLFKEYIPHRCLTSDCSRGHVMCSERFVEKFKV